MIVIIFCTLSSELCPANAGPHSPLSETFCSTHWWFVIAAFPVKISGDYLESVKDYILKGHSEENIIGKESLENIVQNTLEDAVG